jgi:tetratricopeptide (TPR) repeat protein
MKRLITHLFCSRRPLGDAMHVSFRKRAPRFAEQRVCSAIVIAFFISSAFAQPDTEFAKATQDYSAGHFQEAISGYETLVRAGEWSANLFYDLGNVYFRAGNFGEAILNYERALALERHHPEADANLRIARDQARALELAPSRGERLLRFASVNEFAIAAAIAFWTAAFSISALLFARRRAAGTIALSILSLSIFAAAVFAIYALENGAKGKALAVVVGDGVAARLATADNSNTILALPPGSEIQILNTRGDWIYAALPNNLRGWIPAKSAEPVRM